MNNKLLFFLLSIFSISLASASLYITLPKSEYLAGENVSITILLESQQYSSGNLVVDIIPNKIPGTIQESYFRQINLYPGQMEAISYYLPVSENDYPGRYDVTGRFTSTNLTLIMQNTTYFSVVGTKNYFNLDLQTCLDVYCSVKSKVFLKTEGIYLDYSSGIENPLIKATLTYPDGAKKQIELPTSIKAEQIGTHEIEVTASKEGYKTITKKELFGVIEKPVEFPLISGKPEITNIMETEIIPKGDLVLVSLIAFIVILIVIVVSIIYFLIKKNETYGSIEVQSA